MAMAGVSVMRKIDIEWDVENFLSLPQKQGESLLSPTFSLSNATWCVEVFPDGDESEASRGHICMFPVKQTHRTEEHHISFTLGIKSTDGEVIESFDFIHKFIRGQGTDWGTAEFITRSEVLKAKNLFTPTGSVTFFVSARLQDWEGISEETESQTSSTKGIDTLLKNLKDLFLSEHNCDVTLKVGDREFKAHKSLLSARSPVFSSMFQHDMSESSSGILNITDLEPDAFEVFLLYLYTGELASDLSFANLLGVFRSAHKYGMEELKKECAQHSANVVCVDKIYKSIDLTIKFCKLLDAIDNCAITSRFKI